MHVEEVIPSKRQQNKAQVQRKLLDVALSLFSTKGYENTTVSDIVEAAEIGRGTFYNYYKDVHSIFNAVMEEMNLEIQQRTVKARAEAHGLFELLYSSFKSFLEYVTSDRLIDFHRKNHAYVRTSAYSSDIIKKIFFDVKDSLIKNNIDSDFKDDYENKLLSYMIVGSATELFLNIISTNDELDIDKMANFLAKLFTKVLYNKKL